MQKLITAIAFFTFCWFGLMVCAQFPVSNTFRQLTVADGLPQSFVSAIVQDSTGFMWIATRDGLARYDGRNFKVFLHERGDTSSLANNIISWLFLDRENRLWILYETGDMDVLNTVSEQMLHLTATPAFKQLAGTVKKGHSMAEDDKGNTWLLSEKGGVFICNLSEKRLKYYSDTALGLAGNKLLGISSREGNIVLLTNKSILTLNNRMQQLQNITYSFHNPYLYDSSNWKDVHAFFRHNGQIVINDGTRVIIYESSMQQFSTISLPKQKEVLRISSAMDSDGEVFIVCNNNIYVLTTENELLPWKLNATNSEFGFKSVFIDQSGLLWLGGNGIGLQVYNLHPPRFSQSVYTKNFHEDVLSQYLQVPEQEINGSCLNDMNSYSFRWLYDGSRKIWFTMASENQSEDPVLCYYSNGHVISPNWHLSPDNSKMPGSIGALALSKAGKLWGMDISLHPVYFDTATYTATVFAPVNHFNTKNNYTINSLLVDGEDRFWISTANDGLFFYDREKQTTIHYSAGEDSTSLPTNQLMNMLQDPADSNIIWMGSIGGGLIRFNKTTGKCHDYTIGDGLPNNTVYAVSIDNNGVLWCSSNKGIFSFNRVSGEVTGFTSQDGLPCDEFNRYHFFTLPGGRLAFGGIEGYTVFDPLKLMEDSFQPHCALTGISVNNIPVDYGTTGSLFKQSVNSLDTIVFDHSQNFVSFTIAALQYNIPEKLQYRYRLEGYDKDWVYTGNNNIITYTKLPPGSYTLKINATNTAGQWSKYVKIVTIIIQPPFWQTTWFIALVIIAIIVLVYVLIKLRIRHVRKEEQQKAFFEKEAAELKAQALRAQMNPHFIFNCLNSIKSLIQDDNKRQAVLYLTTFAKLIRNQLNNIQSQVSLHAELETCRLYTQLESLRFGANISCHYDIEEGIDLHSLQVPPLVLQPFIENAIWHGILPKNGGEVKINVYEESNYIGCTIDDNGVGRELSLRNKSQLTATHESKGMKLVTSRLNLHNNIHKSHNCTIQIVDKKDADGTAAGTTVIIKFYKE